MTDGHFEQAIGGGAPGGANGPEMVQNRTGQGRTKRDRAKGRSDSETVVSPEKPMKNATPGKALGGGVSCSQKEYNTCEKQGENADLPAGGGWCKVG